MASAMYPSTAFSSARVLGPRFAKVVAEGLSAGVVADGREWK
jgi:hypothetical protein